MISLIPREHWRERNSDLIAVYEPDSKVIKGVNCEILRKESSSHTWGIKLSLHNGETVSLRGAGNNNRDETQATLEAAFPGVILWAYQRALAPQKAVPPPPRFGEGSGGQA